MRLTFLGTGTSTGVPQLNCDCEVCKSDDARDKRLRTSALLEYEGKNILIDCGPDFREQMLRSPIKTIDAILITHSHYDHTGGIDDLRPYSYQKKNLTIYGPEETTNELMRRQPYCFGKSDYPGVPKLQLSTIGEDSFEVESIRVTPLPILHGRMPITGYRIGGLSYVTDCLTMPDETKEKISGSHTLILNALRHTPHISHLSLGEALDIINDVKPERAYLIHCSHQIGRYEDLEKVLPPNVMSAYDGLSIEIPD